MKNTITFFVFVFIALLNTQAQNSHVTGVSPISHSMDNEINMSISIDFDAVMNETTLNNQSFKVFGRWSGPMSGNVNWTVPANSFTWTPTGNFIAGEWVTVMLSHGLSSIENYDLIPYAFNFWIKAQPGFTLQNQIEVIEMRLPGEGHIQCYGAYAGDLDDDGYSDLAIINEITQDVRVMLNDNVGSFGDFNINPLPGGSTPSPSEGADFNGDNIIDIAIGNKQNNKLSVLMGLGEGLFATEVAYDMNLGVSGVGIIDANGDGWDDVVSANRSASNLSLLLNDGTGDFLNAITFETSVAGETSIAVVDVNNDGLMDIVFGGASSYELSVLIGDGNGNFTQGASTFLAGLPWMIAAGDLNGDGNVDIASCISNLNKLGICFGNGSGVFSSPIFYATGAFPLAIDIGDIDGDGDLDVISSNYSGANFTLYENDGSGGLINVLTYPASTAGSCTVLHDRDNDGDIDITGIDEEDDLIFLYENPGSVGISDVNREDDFIVFPNPTSGIVRIDLNSMQEENITLEWYSFSGKLISTELISHDKVNTITRVVPDETNGLVLLRISGADFNVFQKIIVLDQR